jgi:hypothetical protein
MSPRHSLALLALVAATFWPVLAHAQRRPYVQRTTSTEVTIVWRDTSATAGHVCVGDAPDRLDRHVGDGASSTQHEIVVDGLAPLTTQYYAVGSASCPPATPGNPADRFTTAPAPGDRVPFRVWIVGDSGTGDSTQARVRDAALTEASTRPFDLFVHVGDMAYNVGSTTEFTDRFFAPYAEVLRNTPVYPAIGNHEGSSSDSASETGPYYEAYVTPRDGRAGGLASGTEAYYAYDWGDVHFVVLDSHESPRTPDGAMLRWLDADLASTSATWIVVYFHHPPYTDGSHDSDTESQLVQMRENALPILEAHGVDLVLAGHSHIYERSHLLQGAYETPTTAAGIVDPGDGRTDGDGPYRSGVAGTLYVVAGHGGAGVSGEGMHPVMFFSEIRNGSTIMDVDGDTLTLRNVRVDGVESDHVTLTKSDGLFVTEPVAGSVHRPGAPLEIAWFHTGVPIERVDLDVTYDDGAHWEPIARGLVDTGRHTWMAPPFAIPAVRIRVRDADRPAADAFSGTFSLGGGGEQVVIPLGAVWEYHDGPMAPPAGWATGEGAGWSEGPAELGYGDGDEATVLADLDPNVASAYFRQSVDLTGATVTAAWVRGVYDDAIAVLVNGRVVHSRNVAEVTDHEAYSTGSDGDDAVLDRTAVPLDALLPGENWIAATVKQDSAGSSDLSFDLELVLELSYPPLPTPDAGLPDAAVIASDASGGPDAPGLDAGPMSGSDAGPPAPEGGCGCRAARRETLAMSWLALVLVVLATARCRRRALTPKA